MKRTPPLLRPTTLALLFALGLGAASWPAAGWAQQSQAAGEQVVKKTLTLLINSIRYKRFERAGQQLGFAGMTKLVCGAAWETMSDAQRARATEDVGQIVRSVSFARGGEIFGYLDAIRTGEPRRVGQTLVLPSTIVVHREFKKEEMTIEWVFAQEQGQWRVVDTIVGGESTAAAIYSEEVAPLVKEGGIAKLLAALKKRADEHR